MSVTIAKISAVRKAISCQLDEAYMLITFHCSKCQAELEGDAAMAGSEVKCPQCGQVLKVPQASIGPGVTIGGFEVIRMLGEGGMGEVYLARQISLGRNVALKILPTHMKMRRGVAERFFKEVKLLARLEHANIVMAHEAGEDTGVMYLAMGYVNGDSLEQKLRREGPVKEDDALQMIGKLAGALDYAWREHKLLHRDIKPSNIMLTLDGELKLMDFGLAKCLAEEGALTLSGTIMGTPNYMSPEQVEGNVELDCRADLYSLGATLYHMVTGQLPFAGSSVMETLRKQVNEALPDPRTINPAVSENCVTLLEIMLSKNRDKRHTDYKMLMDDIQRVRAGNPPLREPLQAGESVMLRAEALGISGAPKPARHRKAPAKSNRKIIMGAAAGVALVFGIGAALVIGLRAPRPDTAKSEGAEKGSAVLPGPVSNQSLNQASMVAVAPTQDEVLARLTKQYLEALTFGREHPDDFAGAMALLEPLAKVEAGTAMEEKITDEIGRVGRVKQQAVEKAITALKAEVQAQIAQSNYDGALKRIELDTGLVTEETKAARAELSKEVKAQQKAAAEGQAKQAAEAEQARQAALAREKLATLAQGLADDLLKDNVAEMSRRLTAARADPALGMVSNAVNELSDQALQTIAWPEQVAKSFEAEKGKEVAVEFKGGRKERLEIIGVEEGRIKAQRKLATGYIGRDFTINELSAGEKLKRMGDDSRAGGKLMRGLVQVRCANNWEGAAQEFTAAGGMLGEALAKSAPSRQAPVARQAPVVRQAPVALQAQAVAKSAEAKKPAEEPAAAEAKAEEAASVEAKKPEPVKAAARRPMGPKEGPAKQALQAILKLADVTGEISEPQALAEAIGQKECSSNAVAQIKLALSEFSKSYSQTQTAQEFAGVLSALGSLEAAMAPVTLKPATEETIKAALAELEKVNGPLKNKKWEIQGNGIKLDLKQNANLKKIDALAGLPLVWLAIYENSVRDLRPLTGMPLVELQVGNLVDNIKPLQNMKTLRILYLNFSAVADLKPLYGLQLEQLYAVSTKVHDISVLKGMPLKVLQLSATTVTDFSALKGMPLERLGLPGLPSIKDVKFIEEFIYIKDLILSFTSVSDLSPLRNMNSLSDIRITGTKVTDLTPLKDKNLYFIDISATGVKSLEPLASSRNLKYLYIGKCTKLTDTDKIPDYFPNLLEISISQDFPHPEILARCASLNKIVVVDKKGQTVLTMDEFKKRYVKAGKQSDKKQTE